MPGEVSWFFRRLIHSRLGIPLKACAGMLLMLLPAGQISLLVYQSAFAEVCQLCVGLTLQAERFQLRDAQRREVC